MDFNAVNTITVILWQKLATSSIRMVYGNNDTGDAFWYNKDTGNNEKQNVYLGATTTPGYHNSNTALTANTWQHVGFVYNGSSVLFYLAGNADGGGNTTGNLGWLNTEAWTMGARDSRNGYYADGLFSEYAIFSRALDSTEINDIMDNGLAPVAAGRTRRFFMVN